MAIQSICFKLVINLRGQTQYSLQLNPTEKQTNKQTV